MTDNEKKDYELSWDDLTKKRETVKKKVKAAKVVHGDIVESQDDAEQ